MNDELKEFLIETYNENIAASIEFGWEQADRREQRQIEAFIRKMMKS